MTVLTQDRMRLEIETLHDFIAAWFRGDVEQSDVVFDNGLGSRLDGGLINIQPSGEVLSRLQLVDGIRAGYGRNREFRIEISDVVVRWADKDRALVTYVEFQQGARNTVPADNARISSVLFCADAGGGDALRWMHIHETAFE